MAVDQDATSGKYLPSSSAQWTELLAGTGIGNPSNLYLFQEASGNASDTVGGKTLTASGSLLYQQAVSGWTRKSIVTTRGTPGRLLNTSYANVNANSATVMLVALVDTTGMGSAVNRTIVRLGDTFDDDACLETNTTPRLAVGEGDGTRSTNSTNPTGTVQIFFLRVDDTGNQVDGFLNATKTAGGTQACNGTELCYGGNNIETNYPNDTAYMYSAVWTSALSDADIASIVSLYTSGPAAASFTATVSKTLGSLTSTASATFSYLAAASRTLGALTVASSAAFIAGVVQVGSGHTQKTQPADETNPSGHAAKVHVITSNPSGHASKT